VRAPASARLTWRGKLRCREAPPRVAHNQSGVGFPRRALAGGVVERRFAADGLPNGV
jgi:hypothetical protein